MCRALFFSSFLFVFGAAVPSLAESENWVWALWENRQVDRGLCEEDIYCEPVTTFVPVLIDQPSTEDAEKLFGSLSVTARRRDDLDHERKLPRICRQVDAAAILGFDPEAWELSDRALALRGLPGVYVKTENVRGPEAYGPSFNDDLYNEVFERFRRVGLQLLNEEEMLATPGQPEMNIYFANTDPDTGCQFRFFAGLSQTMLLTRNHTVKMKAGSWGATGGWDGASPEIDEMASILIAIDQFVEDWVEANASPLQADHIEHSEVTE